MDRLPLYNIEKASRRIHNALQRGKTITTWVVEGEKCVEVTSNVIKADGSRINPNLVSACGGSSKNIESTDWSPLYGHRVVIFADADEPGRKFAKAVGKHLHENQCEVKFILPPGDDHYDVADAVSAGGWEKVLQFLNHCGNAKRYEDVINPKTIPLGEPVPASRMASTQYFRIMGMAGEKICIQSKKTHKIHSYSAGQIFNEGTLLQLAPAEFWDALAGSNKWSGPHKRSWVDAMIRAAEKGGEIDIENKAFWRRGARTYKDEDGKQRYMFHSGTKLLYEDGKGRLKVPKSLSNPDDNEIYLPCPPMQIIDDESAIQYSMEFAATVLQYRWLTPHHGHVLLGWIVTSLIGGALPFRPAIWLTAAAGAGKTYVIESILKPIFGDLVMPLSNATEAGLAALSTDSALPCLLDEFEPDQGKKSGSQDAILALLRMATSGEGARVRGKPEGGVVAMRPRFSLMMSSINRPVLSDANLQRIVPIRLSMTGVEDWLQVRNEIARTTTKKALPGDSISYCSGHKIYRGAGKKNRGRIYWTERTDTGSADKRCLECRGGVPDF